MKKMHYFLLIYFNNKPLYVSSTLAAHHEDETTLYKQCMTRNNCKVEEIQQDATVRRYLFTAE